MTHRFIREVKKLLDATSQPYEIVHRNKHEEIYLVGKKIATISRGGTGRDTIAVQSAIRQRLMELE